jgi:asparagine synthase (glutamine-hydrolysing)
MCGIAGIVGPDGASEETLARMAGAMAHRGPDGQGTWADGGCGLGFRRLAIIDLDERSDQPLHFERWHLVFNGEIYNYVELREELRGRGHRFVTEGDGEVLLHAWAEWGEAALGRLNGMFAFAVWDERDRVLTLATDAFGEKPVYVCERDGRFAFGSDVRALIAGVDGIGAASHEALATYLARGIMPEADRSYFDGVRRVPGAHVVRVQDGRASWLRWWTPAPAEGVPTRYGDAVDALRELLTDSIRLRLRADVPVGTSLSGGVDSSSIVGLSAALAGDHRRHAFTARFPGFERDEWHHAHAVAEQAGVVEHHAVEPTFADVVRDAEALVRDQEEPFGGLSIYAQWRVNAAAREAGVTVLLDGQGADELFAGYDRTVGYALRTLGPRPTAAALRSPRWRTPVAVALGTALLPGPVARALRGRAASPYVARELVPRAAAVRRDPPSFATGDPLRRELLQQQFVTPLPELLRYADRDSMAHSREVRLPFLDRRLAEFALALPVEFLYRDGVTKAILRDAVRGVIPAQVLERTDKVAFEPPQARWLNSPEGVAWVTGIVLDPGALTAPLLDRAALEADVRAGRWRDHAAVWRAVNAELWQRAFAPARESAALASPA